MDFLPLLFIPILFIVVALLKPHIQDQINWNLCAICVAVSSTWIILLVLLWKDIIHNTTPIAILMGMSVVGIMYKLEAIFKERSLQHLWFVRLITILGGFLSIMLFTQRNWEMMFLSLLAAGLLLVIVSLLMQGTTHKDALDAAPKGICKSLIKKLDNCC